jgi:hypothetical protein
MAQDNKYGNERTGMGSADPTSHVLSDPSTSSSRSVDPETHPISTTAGLHTGREEETGSGMRERVGAAADRAGARTGEMADSAQARGSHMADQAREKAGRMADQARQQMSSQISGQKDRATESLGSIAQALRQTSGNLRSSDQAQVAGFVDTAAEQIDRLSGYLQQHTVNDLLNEAERLARREPALFIGGAFVLGLLGARFLKSHSPRQEYSGYGGSEYGGGYRYGGSQYDTYSPGTTSGVRSRSRTTGYRSAGTSAGSRVEQPRGWEVE